MTSGPEAGAVSAVAALAEPVRRALYDVVATASTPMTREEAARLVGVSRKLATFHLEKLHACGLLEVRTAASAPSGRVGRRPRVYERAATDVQVSLPPRRPQLLAQLLLHAMLDTRRGEEPTTAALRVSRSRGHAKGAEERQRVRPGRLGAERALSLLRTLLGSLGFAPSAGDGRSITFTACPFHPLAAEAPELVCGIHHAYLDGLLEGLDASTLEAVLMPGTNGCCVELRPRAAG